MEKKFSKIKNDILGKNYSLSIACVSPKKSRELNKKYRKIDKPANVLSFPLSKNSGEIVLCPAARGQHTLGFLVIHGMLHLKGSVHSSKMEREETKYDKKYFGRNRRGLGGDARRGRGILQGRKKS